MKKIIIIIILFTGRNFCSTGCSFYPVYVRQTGFEPCLCRKPGTLAMDMLTRIQWVGIEGAARTISFTAHTPLKNPHIGLGFEALRDELGPTMDYGV